MVFRRFVRTLISAAMVTVTLTVLLCSQQAVASVGQQSLSVTLIGDSYSAGNGAGNYYGESGSYQSRNNWAHKYIDWLNAQGVKTTFTNLAFSGYTTSDVIDKRISLVPQNTDLVMMTVGGNDVDFASIVQQCFVIGVRDANTCEQKVNAASGGVPEMMRNTERIFSLLEAKLGSSAQIVFVSYPLLSLNVDYTLAQCSNKVLGVCTWWKSYPAAREVRELGLKATREQQNLVNRWNSSHGLKVTFIADTATAFAGHEPNPSVLDKNNYRWINEFMETEGRLGSDGRTTSSVSADMNNWYHPNIIGHDKMGQLVINRMGIPSAAKQITATSGDVDIAFVIDTTGSMWDDIDAVKRDVTNIAANIRAQSRTSRFSLVSFKDHASAGGEAGDYPSLVHLGFTSDVARLQEQVNTLSASGGGDIPESVYSGAMAALDLSWRPGVRKIMIIIGDAPAKDPEPITGYIWSDVARRAFEIDPVEIYAIDTGSLASQEVTSLVKQTGGEIYRTSSASNIPAVIVSAVTRSLEKPFAWIQGPYIVKVGVPIEIDARGSYSANGEIIKYEWDFDGNGVYDLVTTEPLIRQTFSAELYGTMGLRITDETGQVAIGSTQLVVSDDGDAIPRAVDNCPAVANQNQSDYDGDGIGDDCDSDPGHATEDKEGVFVIIDGVASIKIANTNKGDEPEEPESTKTTSEPVKAVKASYSSVSNSLGIAGNITPNLDTQVSSTTFDESKNSDGDQEKLSLQNLDGQGEDEGKGNSKGDSTTSVFMSTILGLVVASSLVVTIALYGKRMRTG